MVHKSTIYATPHVHSGIIRRLATIQFLLSHCISINIVIGRLVRSLPYRLSSNWIISMQVNYVFVPDQR